MAAIHARRSIVVENDSGKSHNDAGSERRRSKQLGVVVDLHGHDRCAVESRDEIVGSEIDGVDLKAAAGGDRADRSIDRLRHQRDSGRVREWNRLKGNRSGPGRNILAGHHVRAAKDRRKGQALQIGKFTGNLDDGGIPILIPEVFGR